MFQKHRVLAACGVMLACGGEAPPAKVPAPSASPPIQTLAPAARKPSPEVARYWVLDGSQTLSLYADLRSLLQSELVGQLAPALLEQLGDVLDGAERACVSALLLHSNELLVGGDDDSGLVVLSLGPEGVKAARSACVGSLLPVERSALPGAEEAYTAGKGVIAVMPGVVLAGSKTLVEAALAPQAKPSALPEHLALRGEEQLSFHFEAAQPKAWALGTLSTSAQRFSIAAQVELPNDAAADNIDKKIAMARSQGKLLAQAMTGDATLARLLDSIAIERHGRRFQVQFELRGTATEQARDLGTVAALGISGVRRYMINAKAAEAKATLAQITKRYQASLLVADGAKPKQALKLLSLPAVPAAVPRGAKYQSSADDWKPWAGIQFKLEQPQYYQYEVVAAKDGKNAEILARGDLDGDGVTSLYRLKIQLDPKTGQLSAQALDETEPFE
jgi:hypothetical protein